MVGNTWEGDNDAREREVVNFAAAACDSIWWLCRAILPAHNPKGGGTIVAKVWTAFCVGNKTRCD